MPLVRPLAPIALVVIAALGCAACSSGDDPSPVRSSAAPVSSTPEASPTPSVDAAALIGQVTLTPSQAAVCGSGDGSAGADDTSVEDGGSSAADDATATEAPGEAPSSSTLMPGGLVIQTCADGELIGMNALNGVTLWNHPATSTDSISEDAVFGTRHVFIVRSTYTEATALDDSFYSRELIALDLTTGDQAWSVPLEEFVPKTGRSSNPTISVVESGGGSSGLTPEVAIGADAWTGLNADTGQELWHNTDQFEKIRSSVDNDEWQYVGDGTVLVTSASREPSVTGLDAKTGKSLWTIRIPSRTIDEKWILDGRILWQENNVGVNAIDIVARKLVNSTRFPAEWIGTVADHQYALAISGPNLIMVSLDDLRTPIWSQPVGANVKPLAVTRASAVVEAESGVQLLDATRAGKGKIRSGIDTSQYTSDWDVVDGLTLFSDGSVLELSPPAGSAA